MSDIRDDDLIEEVLKEDSRGLVSRVFGAALSVLTVVTVLGLFVATFVQVRQIDARTLREAYAAHQRQIALQQILDSTRLVQAISAEQQLAARETRGGCDPAALVRVIMEGEPIGFTGNRCLREAIEAAPEGTDKLKYRIARDIYALERSVAPLSESAEALTRKALFRNVEAMTKTLSESDAIAGAMGRARLHTLALGVGGVNPDARANCEVVLDAPATPESSLEIYTWQAECLRKLPDLAPPNQPGTLERFERAIARIEATAPVCGGEAEAGRAFSVMAARAYNGYGMSIVARGTDLERARSAILNAVCYREQAQQTASQVAGSQENLAVIAYRRFFVSGDRKLLEEARCEAEKAVAANANLPWSWTLLYIAERYGATCQGKTAHGLNEIEAQLKFFQASEFDREELVKLIPLARDAPVEPGTIEELLNRFEEQHRRFKSKLDRWQQDRGGVMGAFGLT